MRLKLSCYQVKIGCCKNKILHASFMETTHIDPNTKRKESNHISTKKPSNYNKDKRGTKELQNRKQQNGKS